MGPLSKVTRHRRTTMVEQVPRAAAFADRLRDRIIEIELARGDVATHASNLALSLGSVDGAGTVTSLLSRLGRGALVRGRSWGNTSREAVYSHLVQVSYPAPSDSPETLQAAAVDVGLPDARLLDLAMYAPQWASFVEAASAGMGSPTACGGSTPTRRTSAGRWRRSSARPGPRLSAERTPLTSDDLVAEPSMSRGSSRPRSDSAANAGEARQRCQARLGWERSPARAALLRGDAGRSRRVDADDSDQDQEAPRLGARPGLLPLPADVTKAGTDSAMLARYAILREFERGSSKFGAQRRASEQLAVRIGVENLARTAGFPDPQRFVWAMEAAEAGELARRPGRGYRRRRGGHPLSR